MIDTSERSALAVCDQCGRREICTSHQTARRWLAEHEAESHAGTWFARHHHLLATRRAATQ